jgi:uncharacterized protein YacL
MSKFIKGAILFVIGMAIMFGLFALGITLFNQYFLAVLVAAGLVYFALFYMLESFIDAFFKLTVKEYVIATMVMPLIFSVVGLVIVKIMSSMGSFSNGSFADLAWVVVLTVVLVISAVALAVRSLIYVALRKRNKA